MRASNATAKAISQLFRLKYVSAKIMSGSKSVLIEDWLLYRGLMPAMRNNSWAATHIETAGAAMLNRARYHSGRRLAIQKEMTSPSSATVMVPADGPNSRTDAKTKVSETEIDAPAVGRFTVADPLTNVSAASMYHLRGS